MLRILRKGDGNNPLLIYISTFALYCLPIAPIIVPFMGDLGLSMTEIMFSESIYALTLVVFEVPSGWMADRLGRVLVIRWGSFFWMLALLILCLNGSFYSIMVFQAFMGIGIALTSGADLSLLYESVRTPSDCIVPSNAKSDISQKPSNLQKVEHAVATRSAWRGGGEVAGALMCLLLGGISIKYLLISQLLIGALPFLLSLYLREPITSVRQERGPWEWQSRSLWRTIQCSPNMILVMGTYVYATSAGFLAVFLLQGWLSELSFDFVIFIWLWFVFQSMYTFGAKAAPELQLRMGYGQWRWLLAALFLASLLLFVVGGVFAWFLGSAFLGLFRGLFQPIITSQLNHMLANDNRATVNSIMQMLLRISTMIFGPVFGWVVDRYGAQSAVLVLCVMFMPVTVLLFAWQKRLVSLVHLGLSADLKT